MPASLFFLTDSYFYLLLLLGCAAMIPRARFAAARASAFSAEAAARIKPNLAERLCLFLPGICLLASVVMLQYTYGAVALLVLYIAAYAGLILAFRNPTAR